MPTTSPAALTTLGVLPMDLSDDRGEMAREVLATHGKRSAVKPSQLAQCVHSSRVAPSLGAAVMAW